MIRLPILLTFLFLIGCDLPESSEFFLNDTELAQNQGEISSKDQNGGFKVIGVKDGDTIELLMNGEGQVVRFAHVDCPEKKQSFGNAAKQFVSNLCFGEFVTLIHENKYDRYKRLIAEIVLADGTNLNQDLIKNGLAWHFKKYSKDATYAQLEIKARSQKMGIWSEPDPIAPWD